MLTHVLYRFGNDKPALKTFDSVDDADKWITMKQKNVEYKTFHKLVDYDSLAFYKEKFEELYKIMFDKLFKKTTEDIGEIK